MKPVLLAAALALSPLTLAVAQTVPDAAAPAQSRTVYLDLAEVFRLSFYAFNAADEAADAADLARVTGLMADRQNAYDNLIAIQSLHAPDSPAIQSAKQNVSDLSNAVRTAQEDTTRNHRDRITAAQHRFNTDLYPALQSYMEVHSDIIIRFRQLSDSKRIIILNQTYDISDSLAEMMKSGPGAEIPAMPQSPAIVRYVNYDQVFSQSGYLDDAAVRANQFRTARIAEADSLMNDMDQITQQLRSPTLTDTSRQTLTTRHDYLFARISQKNDEITAQIDQENDRLKLEFQNVLIGFLKTHSDVVSGIDIVHIYKPGPEGHGFYVGPNLDISNVVVAIMKEEKLAE